MIFQFDELSKADLIPGAIYKGGDYKNPMKDDPLSKIFKIEGYKKGVGNRGGFRKASKEENGKIVNGTIAFVVMLDTGNQDDWPNSYNKDTNIFTYYGDNRIPGNDIFKTKNLGNKFLYDIFNKSYSSPEARKEIPPIFIFKSTGEGSDKKFIGLAIPGISGKSMEESLKRKTFIREAGSFENYEANFTVLNLDENIIKRDWLSDLKSNNIGISYNAPKEWQEFIINGVNIDNSNSQYYQQVEVRDELYTNYKNETERKVKVRVTQGPFRDKLIQRDKKCVLCGLGINSLLIASHIKPWSKSNNYEKQDENNGLLLCANHDALFDKGYISFNELGNILISEKIDLNDYINLNINDKMHININLNQLEYMKYHREEIFLDNKN